MVLTAAEEALIGVLRSLPPREADRVLSWARHLVDLTGGQPIDWSDSWTDEDLEDITRVAVQQFEAEERESH